MTFQIGRQLLETYTQLPPSAGLGSLFTASPTNTYMVLAPPTTDNQFLSWSSTSAVGLEWTHILPQSDGLGTLYTADTNNNVYAVPPPFVSGKFLSWSNSAPLGVEWIDPLPQSFGKGTLYTADISNNIYAIAPPTSATVQQVLSYSSSATYGAEWVSLPASTFPTTNVTGSLFVSTGNNKVFVLPPGNVGQVLTVASGATTGLAWQTPSSSSSSNNGVETIVSTLFTTTAVTTNNIAINVTTSLTFATDNYFYVQGKTVMKSSGVGLSLQGASYDIEALFRKEFGNITESPGATVGSSRLTFEDEVNPTESQQSFNATFTSDTTFIYFEVQQPTSATMSYQWNCIVTVQSV